MRLNAQPFLWKWVLFAWEWKSHGHIKGWDIGKTKRTKYRAKEWNKRIGPKKPNTKVGQKKFGQKFERDSRTKNDTKRSTKTSDNKLGQKISRQNQPKIGHINSDKIVGQNSRKQNRTRRRTKYRAKKSNKKSDKESDKIVGQRNRIRHLKNSDKK